MISLLGSYMMEKEMLAVVKLKPGEGTFEKFMSWMQSDEGMSVRKSIAYPEKTIPGIGPDKGHVMFKVTVHDEDGMKEFVSGKNPLAKPTFDACVEHVNLWELIKTNI